MAQLVHWKTHYPALYAQLQEKLRYCSEEEVEIFNGMVRGHVRWKKTSEQVVRAINAWGSNMKMLRSWRPRKVHSQVVRARSVQLTTERVTAASVAIKRLFQRAATTRDFCRWDAAEGQWHSHVLGTFADHALPYALQRAKVRIRGCSAIENDDRVAADGYVDPKHCRPCGHQKRSGAFCMDCLESTLHVVREMMDQSVLCGAIRMDPLPAIILRCQICRMRMQRMSKTLQLQLWSRAPLQVLRPSWRPPYFSVLLVPLCCIACAVLSLH
jgi:hypothetical protein